MPHTEIDQPAFRSDNPSYPVMTPQEVLSDAMLGVISHEAYVLYAYLRVMTDTTTALNDPDDGSPNGPVRHDFDDVARRLGVSRDRLEELLAALQDVGWISLGEDGIIKTNETRRIRHVGAEQS